jgi:hypothetical protein
MPLKKDWVEPPKKANSDAPLRPFVNIAIFEPNRIELDGEAYLFEFRLHVVADRSDSSFG